MKNLTTRAEELERDALSLRYPEHALLAASIMRHIDDLLQKVNFCTYLIPSLETIDADDDTARRYKVLQLLEALRNLQESKLNLYAADL